MLAKKSDVHTVYNWGFFSYDKSRDAKSSKFINNSESMQTVLYIERKKIENDLKPT